MKQNANRPRLTNTEIFFQILRDPDRKSIPRMIREFFYLYFYYKEFPRQYFSRYLFKKSRTNLLDYYPWKFLYNIKHFFNEKELCEVLENKLYYDFFYRQFNFSLPKILMYNHRNLFVIGKKYFEINSPGEFRTILAEIIKKNSSASNSVIVKKTYWSYGGDKVFKVFLSQISSDPARIDELYEEVTKSGFLFQETIIQHPVLDRLNPSCVNTIRFDTYINPESKVEVISAYLRMSYTNCDVDNVSMGGCFVGIDMHTGRLRKEGFSNLIDLGVTILTKHPVTNIVFETVTIPYFEEARELVKKAASYMPGIRLVGWDVAIGVKEPILIEGNSDYDNTGNDLSEGGYRTNAVFQKVLKEYNVLKKQKTSNLKS
jgi:hypothetical protein